MMNIVAQLSLPILAASVALLYWRRASLGLETHLKRVALGFALLATYETLSLANLFRESKIVSLVEMVGPFGSASIVAYIVLAFAALVLLVWTWYYLLKRLQTQLFILSMSGVVILALLITGTFVSLLLKSVEVESLGKLNSNALVVSSLIDEKKARLLGETKLFASDQSLILAYQELDRKGLYEKVRAQMGLVGAATFVITDSSGKVIINGENEEERGISWSGDKYVERALNQEYVSGVVTTSGVVAPIVAIKVAVPLSDGVIVVSQVLDNVFVDALKERTQLSVFIYGDQTLSASTIDIGDGKTRLFGIKETNKQVLEKVWGKGEVFATGSKIGDSEYLSAYVPLKDHNNETQVVLQVAQPQIVAVQAAGAAISMTFGFIVLLMVVMAVPLNIICEKLVADWK